MNEIFAVGVYALFFLSFYISIELGVKVGSFFVISQT